MSAPTLPPRAEGRSALEGVVLVDFGQYLAGPFGPMVIGDLGADVIKVEPLTGDGMRFVNQPFTGCQRGKRDIALDLKNPKGLEVAKKLGQIEEYHIYRSDMPQSGDFNLMLVVKFKDANSANQPNKAQYDAFIKEFTKQKSDEVTEFSQKNYPAMREITGQYQVREITIKK